MGMGVGFLLMLDETDAVRHRLPVPPDRLHYVQYQDGAEDDRRQGHDDPDSPKTELMNLQRAELGVSSRIHRVQAIRLRVRIRIRIRGVARCALVHGGKPRSVDECHLPVGDYYVIAM